MRDVEGIDDEMLSTVVEGESKVFVERGLMLLYLTYKMMMDWSVVVKETTQAFVHYFSLSYFESHLEKVLI